MTRHDSLCYYVRIFNSNKGSANDYGAVGDRDIDTGMDAVLAFANNSSLIQCNSTSFFAEKFESDGLNKNLWHARDRSSNPESRRVNESKMKKNQKEGPEIQKDF